MRFLLQKVLATIPTFIGISIFAFFLIRWIPGDPVLLKMGERGMDPVAYERMKASLGLDRPLFSQYLDFVSGALRGDLGDSIQANRPVWDEFISRFPATLELSFFALLIAIFLGIPLGVLAAVKRNSIWDYLSSSVALVGFSMPIFWWALILILFFSVGLGWTPVSGRIDAAFDVPEWSGFMLIDVWRSDEPWAALRSSLLHLILPAFALGTIPLAAIARMTRSSLLEVLGEDYVRAAKARGISNIRVIWRHALRNALVPVGTVIGLMAGGLVTGAVLTETIFSWPGVGKWIVAGVLSRDYPVFQGGILLLATVVLVVNLLMEVFYVWANPRLRGASR